MAGVKQNTFVKLYRALNPAQKEAVDTIEGPVMVVAGPGTGKTHVLTLRIANILRLTDTAPENILALTFTESAALGIRRRLAEIIGSRAYAVVINTFHGFCNEAIKKYPEYFPRIVGSRSITEIDQINIIESVIGRLTLPLLRPFGDPRLYVSPVNKALEELKRQGVTPERFLVLGLEAERAISGRDDLRHAAGPYRGQVKASYQKLLKQVAKNRELGLIYEAYEKYLRKHRFYDFSDMVMEVLKALEHDEELLRLLQEEHQYLLVDEHQDTNNAQNRVLESLSGFHPNPNLFVVGDEKQAIFRFQGASLENFLYFQKRYPQAKLITLVENYRSTQTILDSAQSLPGFAAAPLQSRQQFTAEPIRVYDFSRPDAELWFVAAEIKKLLRRGIRPESIAVLYRDNKDALPLGRWLERLGVPFTIESDQDLLSHPDVKKLILIMRAAARFGDDEFLVRVLHVDYFRLDPLDIYETLAAAAKPRGTVHQLLADERRLKALRLRAPERLRRVYRLLAELNRLSRNLDLLAFSEKLIRGSGALEQILAAPAAGDRLQAINRFYNEAARLVESHAEATLDDFLDYLETVSRHRLLIKRQVTVAAPGKARLLTVHRAKGLEFEHIFIVNAHDGHFGNRFEHSAIKLLPSVFSLTVAAADAAALDRNDDERRLFYVALTRAARSIRITYARQGPDGREQLPSLFIGEIKPELLHYEPTAAAEKSFQAAPALAFSSPPVKKPTSANREFVRRLFQDQGFSVTGLNNYLTCPWRYFYRNLLRIPEALTKHQRYGIAVHSALRDFFRRRALEPAPVSVLLESFAYYLQRQPWSRLEHEEVRRRGRQSLRGWHRRYAAGWPVNVLTEFKIKGVLLTSEIRLTGVLDKVEFLSAGSDVNVVDYKTRRPMSRREIEGKTKGASGNYWRQLVFYKLLLDRYEAGRYRMASGEIDFLEPDARGRYRKEVFAIGDEPVRDLEKLIKSTAREILSLGFWSKRCPDKDCAYCSLGVFKPSAQRQSQKHHQTKK